MHAGHYISGAGHLGLIGWLLIGSGFAPTPEPMEVSEVAVISAEDYAALTAPGQAPEAAPQPVAPVPPEATDTPPDRPAADADAPPARDDPAATPASPPDAAPDVTALQRPAPTEAEDTAPQPPAAPPESATLAPETSERPTPRPAPRVAPEPVAPPEPDTRVDEVRQQARTPDAGADTAAQPQEATAPEAAATEIVTEAEESPAAAPRASLRPRARPAAPAAPGADASDEEDPYRAALEEALAGDDTAPPPAQPAPAPAGPPLSRGERDALRVAVQACWNVGSLSSAALATTVVVGVSMGRDGRPDVGSIRLIGSEGGNGEAVKQAYEAARRAVIRCGASGYDLPEDKYARWRDIEMTFNPEKMRIK